MNETIVRRIAANDARNIYRADKPRGGVNGPTTASPQSNVKGDRFLAYSLKRQHHANMRGDVTARQGNAIAIRDASAAALNAKIAAIREAKYRGR